MRVQDGALFAVGCGFHYRVAVGALCDTHPNLLLSPGLEPYSRTPSELARAYPGL
jgi:hypothetical protein